jgi:hypothetical protein
VSYRQHRYDPFAASIPGRPLRPFNWVQWFGVGFESLAILWLLLHAAQQFGWLVLTWEVEVQPATLFALLGMPLINSRRETDTPIEDEEQRRLDRKWLLGAAAFTGFVLAILLIAEFAR